VRVIDLSVPASPREMGFLDAPGFAFDVDTLNHLALVATGVTGLRAVDIGAFALTLEKRGFTSPG
jgi:hypothetical protein